MRSWGPVLAGVVACACGGDDGGAEEPRFRVLGVTPMNGATEVDIASAVAVEFSEPVDPASVDAETVALEGVEADPMVDGSTVTIAAVAPLPYETAVELVITTQVTSTGGEPLAAAYSGAFTTRWRVWSEPEAIGPGSDQTGTSLFRPLVTGVPTGDAVAVWEDDAEGAYRLSGARYAADSGTWIEDAEIASGGTDYTLDAQLASDEAGRILLVWRSANRIEHAWFHADNSAWYHGAPVHIGEAVVSAPVLAMSPGGMGAVLWSESAGRRISRLLDDEWTPPEALGGGDSDGAAIAVDDEGAITVVWRNASSLVARRSEGDAWDVAEPLWTDSAGAMADRARVAALPGGGAIATWGVSLEEAAEVHVRFFDPGSGWGADTVIGAPETPGAPQPELAVTDAGDVLVVWAAWNGGLFARWWRRAGDSWEEQVTLAGDDIHAPEHAVAVDAEGNAVTAYGDLFASVYRADRREWSSHRVGTNSVTIPIAVTVAGSTPVAVWEQYSYDEQGGEPVQDGIRASFFR